MAASKSGCGLFLRHTAVLLFILMLSSCSSNEPVKIGFIASLTGNAAALGTAGRDGALLAVEEANTHGGINGRRIEMVTRDNRQSAKNCKLAIAELIEENVVGVVGPMTSAMALVLVPMINEHSTPTVSPTASTELLAEIGDYFFRIIPVSSDAAVKTARYAYNEKNYRKLFVVYDKSNSGYTLPWFEKLKTTFEEFENGKVEDLSYTSTSSYNFLEMARNISKKNVDCLVILANSLDTALISQQLSKLGVKVPILACEWSLTDDIVEFGGKAVEGITLFHSFDPNSDKKSNMEFNLNFQKRFGYDADFASAYGYNAMKILIGALKESLDAEQVKKSLLDNSPYQGVQHEVRFNSYGDVIREYTLLKIEHGKIISL